MPVADPRAGRLFVWLISCFILLSLATGGAFLAMYMVQPDPTTSTWLLYAGMSLVCFPWFFWLMLCLYRCISRSLGFRIICGGGGGDDAGISGRGGAGGSATMNRAGSLAFGPATNGNSGAGNTENANGRHVHFGTAVVVSEGGGGGSNDPRDIGSRSSSSSSSNNDISFKSHESEIPLASAMAT